MNSFKKVSLIIAAALTSTMLVSPAANANAGTVTLTVAGSAATGGTVATTPVSLPVPADNSVDAADALKIAVTGVDTGTVVSAVAVNATIVPALATSTAPVTASSGTSSLTINTGTGNTADFYVYTKSTAVGTVSVTRAGTTTVYYVQGSAGALNSITLTTPASAAAGTSQVIKVSGYDVFGNLKGGATINTLVSNSGAATATALTSDTATATLGTKEQTILMPASGAVTVVAYATVATAVTGLSAPVGSVSATIAVRDLASELSAKNAEVASLISQLAVSNAALAAERAGRAADKVASDKALADAKIASDSATVTAKVASDLALATAKAEHKAKFNALAKKWNAKNPKAKVALIK
jgi:epidermal growth factor receptor substrate 15